jgi:hypothetical protein
MNKEQQELLDEAYKNWCRQFEVDPNNFDAEELSKGHNDQCWGYPTLDYVKPTSKEYKRGQINAYLEGKAEKPFFYLTQEEFINKCKTDTEFSEKWGLTIEERELSENEINDLKLKLILNHLNKKNIITVSFEDFKNDEDKIPNIDWRREVWDIIGWIDYGRDGDRDKLKEVYADIKNIPTKLITITYNDKTIESYEY